jgi:hypothetical protein
VALLTRWEDFIEKLSTALGFLSLPTPPRDPSIGFGAFSLNTVKMDLRLSWMGVLEESPLLWLGIDAEMYWIYVSNILLKLSGFYVATVKLSILVLMFSTSLSVAWIFFANFIIYPYLICVDISERGLISVEILPISTLLAVVERKTGFVPPSIEALIRMKMIIGITNEVDVLGDRRVVDGHVAYFFALLTRYSGVNHFEMIEAWVLMLLHKKINLGGEHVQLFKLVNLAGVGLSALLIPALVRGHLLN